MSRFEAVRRLSGLGAGARGVVVRVADEAGAQIDRLTAVGVTPGAHITVLQTFPGIVFLCDQTELAVEPSIGHAILVDVSPGPGGRS